MGPEVTATVAALSRLAPIYGEVRQGTRAAVL